MLAKAKAILRRQNHPVANYDEFKQVVEGKGGFIKAAWCGNPDCEAKIKDQTGATIRVIPFEKEEPKTGCVYCGKKAKEVATSQGPTRPTIFYFKLFFYSKTSLNRHVYVCI